MTPRLTDEDLREIFERRDATLNEARAMAEEVQDWREAYEERVAIKVADDYVALGPEMAVPDANGYWLGRGWRGTGRAVYDISVSAGGKVWHVERVIEDPEKRGPWRRLLLEDGA